VVVIVAQEGHEADYQLKHIVKPYFFYSLLKRNGVTFVLVGAQLFPFFQHVENEGVHCRSFFVNFVSDFLEQFFYSVLFDKLLLDFFVDKDIFLHQEAILKHRDDHK
jgi:hypothetical protein